MTTCAACGVLVTNVHPLWMDVALWTCVVAIAVGLALVNFERWRSR